MSLLDRRSFLRLSGASIAAASLPLSIRRALAIPAASETGTIADVQHVVILMQENRSFDQYFGSFPGVRGFGDRFTIPLPQGRSVWEQHGGAGETILPYHLDSTVGNAQRVSGTPHGWDDAHAAWDKGRMSRWPVFKEPQSMGYYTAQELPFQYALADAFTVCDAYHCAIASSTNPNRLFMFTGTNDPFGTGGGPAIDNTNDDLGPPEEGYTWTTFPERLEAAGISWKVYQDMDDNFTDNSLEGFRQYREAFANDPSSPLMKGLTTTLTNANLDGLREDVLNGQLPQVSWIVGPAAYSEHPGPSSPVQGGWYMQAVLDALTADPEVWSRTVLFVTFDENDGFFDHVPPPCAPSLGPDGRRAGASTVDDASERLHGRMVFGPGPRVPMIVVSPWSRGGWVCSEVFDHTSLVRFIETRFGVVEPNVSDWRRTVCGDLTSAFNFANPNDEPLPALPTISQDQADAIRVAQEQLPQIPAPTGDAGTLPVQQPGYKPSRALAYRLSAVMTTDADRGRVRLQFGNEGRLGAVFQVYDRLALDAVPRRYTVGAGRRLADSWTAHGGRYALWLLGPNGFHREFAGSLAEDDAQPEVTVGEDGEREALVLQLRNDGSRACRLRIDAAAYRADGPWTVEIPPHARTALRFELSASGRWYDFTVACDELLDFRRRFAGRVENGRHSVSDPAMRAV